MTIWIDLTNSPHVQFFRRMIETLMQEHRILVTCRPLSNTVELLDMYKIPYHVVGSHYGKSILKKSFGFPLRILQLCFFLLGKEVDVAISHSSFYSPVVARLLNLPSIYLNDNEYAAGNFMSFVFADEIMVPEFLTLEKLKKQWANPNKVLHYPGVKEAVYLWDYNPTLEPYFEIKKQPGKKIIFVRPEPWTAQYYRGSRNFMDQLLIDLQDDFHVVLLPRNDEQKTHYKEDRFGGITVTEHAIGLSEVIKNCDLFIGAGGTMTREAAVLGIPTISIYQEALLDVDRYLIEHGDMIHDVDLTAEKVISFLRNAQRRPSDKSLLEKGRRAYEMIMGRCIALGN